MESLEVPEPRLVEISDEDLYECPGCADRSTTHWDYQLHWLTAHDPDARTVY